MCKLNHNIWVQIPHVNQNSLHTLESAFNKLSNFRQGLCSSLKVAGIPIQTEPGQDRNRDRKRKVDCRVRNSPSRSDCTEESCEASPDHSECLCTQIVVPQKIHSCWVTIIFIPKSGTTGSKWRSLCYLGVLINFVTGTTWVWLAWKQNLGLYMFTTGKLASRWSPSSPDKNPYMSFWEYHTHSPDHTSIHFQEKPLICTLYLDCSCQRGHFSFIWHGPEQTCNFMRLLSLDL